MAEHARPVWQEAVVADVRDVAERIRRVELILPDPVPVRPGEHLDVRVQVQGKEAVRSYSIVDAAGDGAVVALSVFDSPTSRGGARAMHALAPGDRIRVTRPLQDFPLRLGAPRYVLLAGGVGITAILGMADLLRRLGADYRLVYTARSAAAMAYRDDVLLRHGERAELHLNDEGDVLDVEGLVAGVTPGTELYMCGPIRLMDAVRRAWIDRRLDPTDLRYETFGNSGWFDPEPFTVAVPAQGVEAEVRPDESLLEALERAGVEMMSDCRRGECGLCQVDVLDLEGTVDHRDVFYSDRQKSAGTRLCCCVSRVVGEGGARGRVSIRVS